MKRHALAIFDDAVPIEDADSKRIKDVIDGRKMLGLMLTGYGKGELEYQSHGWAVHPDHVAVDLLDAVQWILEREAAR